MFTPSQSDIVTIIPLYKNQFADWLTAHPEFRDWLIRVGFQAEPGTFAFIPGSAPRVLAAPLIGEPIWTFAGLPTQLPEGRYRFADNETPNTLQDWTLGWMLGSYQFQRYRNSKRRPAELVWPERIDAHEVQLLVQAVYLARDLINTPAEDLGPAALADVAADLAKRHGARLKVIIGDELLQQNFPAIHLVGRSSPRVPHLIDLVWGNNDHPKVTLVGKGVCFDTGGLQIKSHDGMMDMKRDMSGAAIMLALASAVMTAKLPLRLRLLIPAADNVIAGNAMRPRDIVRMRDGKTVEITNTDAEGRLLLADALVEADSEAPQLLLDCATLTGAAKVALGTELQAVFCDDETAVQELLNFAQAVGDPLWRLPLWRSYRKHLEGQLSHLVNFAKGPFGDAIHGALFLSEFVQYAATWAHLDVFAANTVSRPGRPEGGEATGLRALYAFIRKRYEYTKPGSPRFLI